MIECHLEIYESPQLFPDSELFSELLKLPPQRRNKVLRFINIIDKKLSYLAYRLLRQGLSKYYNISEDEPLRIGYYRNGKPILLDYPHIHFNISHCHQAVVCAFASRPIGVDVEGLIEFDDDLLQRVANVEERVAILNDQDPEVAFTILWTKKESYMKMTGVGLVDDLHTVLDVPMREDIQFESRYVESQKYALTICC